MGYSHSNAWLLESTDEEMYKHIVYQLFLDIVSLMSQFQCFVQCRTCDQVLQPHETGLSSFCNLWLMSATDHSTNQSKSLVETEDCVFVGI